MISSFELPLSPVSAAFSGIEWDPLNKLVLCNDEKLLLRSAEANTIDYTLTDGEHANAYAKLLLKVLDEASGPLSKQYGKNVLSEADALKYLYSGPMGVVLHYAIVKLYEVIVCVRERKETSSVSIRSTFYTEDGSLIDDWRPLLRILYRGGTADHFAQMGAALCLAYILLPACPSQKRKSWNIKYSTVKEPLQSLVSWIASQLQSSAGTSLSSVTPTLTALMTRAEAREIFIGNGGIGYLARHLRSSETNGWKQNGASVQQLYELAFCLWTLTYESSDSASARESFARDGAVSSLVDLVSSAPREKVVRVSLSALRNLAQCMPTAESDTGNGKVTAAPAFMTEMIGCGLMKSIDHMKTRQWKDPDIIDDIEVLYYLLIANYKDMSRWDIYKSEVECGQLNWGVLHTEDFFKQNVKKFEGPEGNFKLLKVLISLLSSEDDDVRAIACFDIGEFVHYYPNGRLIVKRFGAKQLVLPLIEHENPELSRHALQCLSKMMITNWLVSNR